jgi:hypothetical protein
MYKDEGNEWLKRKTDKDTKAARDQYTYSLQFIEKAILELAPTASDERDELDRLKSMVLSNRAMGALNMHNYGMCISDCTLSIGAWVGNIKAYYRKCKGIISLYEYLMLFIYLTIIIFN